MLDIDYFKSVNDNYGHEAGDQVLKMTAQLIQKHFGQDFLAARLGGEEFSIFFDDVPLEQARQRLELFRQEFEQQEVSNNDQIIKCTVSIGVTTNNDPIIDSLVNKADELLYEAKESGRNRIVSELSGNPIPNDRPSTARSESRNTKGSE